MGRNHTTLSLKNRSLAQFNAGYVFETTKSNMFAGFSAISKHTPTIIDTS